MKNIIGHILLTAASSLMLLACGGSHDEIFRSSCEFARYFDIMGDDSVVVISPDGTRDTVVFAEPVSRIVCMSSTHVACLSAIGADSLICAVSGVRYISDSSIVRRHSAAAGNMPADKKIDLLPLYDIGYDNSLDYELILSLAPDLLLAYSVSASEPQYIIKLRSLGIPVLVLHDYREEHPLARAEYVKLFGTIAGRKGAADSLFAHVRDNYLSLAACAHDGHARVLMNVPYSDAWYIPGTSNYMARLVSDAGGEVLGAEPGVSGSGIISLEQAYSLSVHADLWLNPGHCSTRGELAAMHHLFPSFGPLANGLPIYNNTLRANSEGGNDFWESGAVRPDLILEDLLNIFGKKDDVPLHYFIRLD